MDDKDDLMGFINQSRKVNLGSAMSEANRIHGLIDFKKYISQAIEQKRNNIEFSFEDEFRTRDEDGNYDPGDGWYYNIIWLSSGSGRGYWRLRDAKHCEENYERMEEGEEKEKYKMDCSRTVGDTIANEYLRGSTKIFAGEETWGDVLSYLVDIIQRQGISCSLSNPLNASECRECLQISRHSSEDFGDGRECTCNWCDTWQGFNSVISGMILSWE